VKKLLFILVLLIAFPVFAADVKVTEMTEDTAPTGDDLTMTVNAPGTSPANRKVTVNNLMKIPVVTKTSSGSNTITALEAMGNIVLLGNSGAISDLTLPDFTAAAAADKAKIGSNLCVYAISAYAHTIHPSGDDKIRTSNGTLNGAGAGITYSTAATPIGGYVCFILTDASSDVGVWTQFGMSGLWPIH